MKIPASLILLLVACAYPSPASAQRFEVNPSNEVMVGNPVAMTLTGLPPNAEVNVRAERMLTNLWRPDAPPQLYRSEARFRAGADGRIDLGSSPALSGSFTGPDPSGLFWSMRPVTGGDVPTLAEGEIKLTASIEGRPVATSSIRMLDRPAGFRTDPVPALPGSYFAKHPGPGKRPVIILVAGEDSSGYNRSTIMPRLVAQGYSVFHFATYSLVYGPGRPAVEGLATRYVDISIDRLEEVRKWLVRQPGVDPSRIGLHGGSRNGAYVLLAAPRYPWVAAVAAITPSDVVFEGWGDGVRAGTTSSYSWRGKSLPFVPYLNFGVEAAKIGRGEPFRLRTPMDEGRWAHPERVAAARIPVERYRGPLFLAAGEQDTMWSAGYMVQNIAERRAAAGLKTRFLIFPDVGHNIFGDGWDPRQVPAGPTAIADARAQYKIWREMLDFFRDTLRPDQPR